MRHSLIALLTTTLLAASSSVTAVPINLSFIAGQFPDSNNIEAPTALVAGTIVYEAADINAPIDSITSIVLSAGGHEFTLADTAFVNLTNESFIGGLLNEANEISINSIDFLLQFQRGPNFIPVLPVFLYTSSGLDGIWMAGTISFNRTVSNVTEPGTLVLLGLALTGLLGSKRRKNARVIKPR